ncbi:MAG: hypothetical protein HYR62_06710 [Actinobacteria bacterium]|nr:hypothetical protein [Actinomycetota bacterium]
MGRCPRLVGARVARVARVGVLASVAAGVLLFAGSPAGAAPSGLVTGRLAASVLDGDGNDGNDPNGDGNDGNDPEDDPGTGTDFGHIVMDCVIPRMDGSFQVVFGYSSELGSTASRPVGAMNSMLPAELDGVQVTDFEPGRHHGAFVTPPVAAASVSWRVGQTTVAATITSRACQGPVSLPSEGNGTGPALVLAGSLIAAAVILRDRSSRTPVA